MPGMNGVELAGIVRERYPGLPVVLTSGYSNVLAESAHRGFELIQKPYSVEVLSRILRKAISEARRKGTRSGRPRRAIPGPGRKRPECRNRRSILFCTGLFSIFCFWAPRKRVLPHAHPRRPPSPMPAALGFPAPGARAKQKSLHLGTSQILHGPRCCRVSTFRGRDHVAVGGDAHHRADDRGRRGIARHFLDEGTVDLDLVEREPRRSCSEE